MKSRIFSSLLLLFLLVGANYSVLADTVGVDRRASLQVSATPSYFHVSKSGNCYFVNRVGEIYKTNLSSSEWSSIKKYDGEEMSNFLGRPSYVFVYELPNNLLLLGGSHSLRDSGGSIYRSEDGGNSFDNSMTETSYIDAMYSDGLGHLWAVDIGQNLYYSADAGKTWTNKPIYATEDRTNRTSSIYFEPGGEVGYITTHCNSILKTTDGGDSFTRIPTPGDQLPSKSKDYGDSMVECFIPVGKHYFVKQYGHIYMSGQDSIRWQKVDSLKWIGRSSEEGLLAITSRANVVFFDSDLNLKWMQKMPESLVIESMHSISGSVLFEKNIKCVCDGQIYFLLTDSYDICSIGEKRGEDV